MERSKKPLAVKLSAMLLLAISVGGEVRAQSGGGLYSRPPDIGRQETGVPEALKNVRIEQRLGEQVPLDITLRDETGQPVQLGKYFGSKPAILALVYYECPMLCSQVLNGLLGSLNTISLTAGRDFEVLIVSFDPREKPELAAAKKKSYMIRYVRPDAEQGWHFLTGDENEIRRLTDAVGFHYAFDQRTGQWAHASGIILLTPQGRVDRYFYGIQYEPRDLRLGLVEASENKIGSPVDQLLLYCFHYDPVAGKYGPVVLNIVKLAGAVTVLGLGVLLFVLWWRESRRAQRATGGVT